MSQEICWYHSAELPPSPSPSRLPTAILKRIKYWSTFQKEKKKRKERKKNPPEGRLQWKIMKSFPGRSRFVLEGQAARWESDPQQSPAAGAGAVPQGVKDGKGCSSHTSSTRASPSTGRTHSTPSSHPGSPQQLKTAPVQASPGSFLSFWINLKGIIAKCWHWDPRTEAWSLILIKMQHPSMCPPKIPSPRGCSPHLRVCGRAKE